MKEKQEMKQQWLSKQENEEELEKIRSGKVCQPPMNRYDGLKYQRGLGQCGKALNKALAQGNM
uniref:Uncharacterized protein n=1 Tax=Romanomermis culicivorax TaxID=13658 RepID=A0A915K0H1_ROMCU